jgi:peptidyl-prolyl cis-trans isomerase SurA
MKALKCINFIAIVAFLGFSSQEILAQKVKIDGVSVVVGKNIVLDSDIAKFKLELQNSSEGKIEISDCEMLEQLMLQKLIAHHAVVDSIVVSEAEIDAGVASSIRYFTEQFGSEEKMVATYGFNDVEDLKKELFKVQKENKLIEREQASITQKIDVTPEEVRLYFNGLKDKGELPEFPAEIEIAQIVLYAESTEVENERIVAKLNKIKEEIKDGASFRLKAIINSEDPGVTQNGGQYEVTKESPFIKEFKEVAFTLDVNEISEPFKSMFGYHLMQLHEIKGNTRVASHILLKPEIPESKLKETEIKVQNIIAEIKEGKLTFQEAVKKYSEDKDTKNSGGLLVNGQTGESRFDLTRMDPALYARVNDLKKGEMTDAYYDELRGGEKMYKFIIMRDRVDTHTADLVDDYVKVQRLALKKKKQEKIASWSKEKIKDTYIKLGSAQTKCTFERNWKKNSNK